jgi:tetratricopeptide (TPR) repeat protein
MIKKNISVLVVTFFSMLLTSCSLTKATLEYTEGTQCMERGDYRSAIEHLEKAVEIEPRYSKFQGNLACAYIGIGELDNAWHHSRKAVLGNGCGYAELYTFKELHRVCVQEKGLEQKGTLLQDVLSVLGDPDERLERDGGFLGLVYGRCILIFYQGVLVESSIERLPGEPEI